MLASDNVRFTTFGNFISLEELLPVSELNNAKAPPSNAITAMNAATMYKPALRGGSSSYGGRYVPPVAPPPPVAGITCVPPTPAPTMGMACVVAASPVG